MKIVVMGVQEEKCKELIDSFLEKRSVFVSPEKSALDKEVELPELSFDDKRKYNSKIVNLNDIEKELYKRLLFVKYQFKEFCNTKNVIFYGGSIPIMLEAMYLCSSGCVSEEFVETTIKMNKTLMKKADIIYWLPSKDVKIEDLEDGDETKEMELRYSNFVLQYFRNYEGCGFFSKNSSAIERFDSDNPLQEMIELINDHGNISDGPTSKDIQKLLNSIKDVRLKDNVSKILQTPQIPLVGGGSVDSGSFEI